jgi:hypothetical protein
MKKLLFLFTFAVFGFSNMNAQGVFKIGGNIGIPVSDASDGYSFTLGVDVYYFFTKIDAPVEFGLNAGFRNYFGKDYDVLGTTIKAEDAQFLPLTAAARLKLFGILSGGADLGYAIGISPDGNDGGFYFRPIVGLDIADTIEINLSYEYTSLQDSVNFGNLNLGVLFEL